MVKQKIYELTTNARGGWSKYYVKGLKTDSEAKKLAMKVFGKAYYWGNGVGYYDDHPSKYFSTTRWKNTPTKSQLIKRMKGIYK